MSGFTLSKQNMTLKPQGRQRWGVLGLLCLLAIINNIDRLTLSIAAPVMQNELHITATDIGLLGSAFALAYAFGQLPSGWFVDRFSPRILLGASVIIWSAATVAMGLSYTLTGFILARIWLGLAEAPSLPATNKIVTRWFPKQEQGIANASWDAALKVGPAFFTFLLIWIVSEIGWREMYFIAGGAGIIAAVIFFAFYRDIEKHKSLTKEEREYIQHDATPISTKNSLPWKELFRHQTMWGMMGGFFCNMWVYQIFLVFIPLYIINQFGIKFSSLGLVASVPWIGAIIGDLVSGVISGKLSARSGWSTLKAKKVTIVGALVLQAVVLALLPFNGMFGEGAGLTVAVILMAFALGFNGGVVAHAWSIPAEVTAPTTVASVAAVQNFGGFLGATVSPLVAGAIVDATHSFTLVFLISAIVSVIGGGIYFWFVGKPIIREEETSSLMTQAAQE
jgi:MFS transporter, ACS family, D-galactonate transporter